jgi:hypothetical protein
VNMGGGGGGKLYFKSLFYFLGLFFFHLISLEVHNITKYYKIIKVKGTYH